MLCGKLDIQSAKRMSLLPVNQICIHCILRGVRALRREMKMNKTECTGQAATRHSASPAIISQRKKERKKEEGHNHMLVI
ncbi:hypothetical protein EYF80_025236 [Liparis tanakae]|uniref:Uncharacterized protein n=1 Tax=Liparis tanakae TaxID=230148 RepID=A0A4Z2HF37_9TELE|nr:hypothetical protein EYF80_025236 [Liparis tanakae]